MKSRLLCGSLLLLVAGSLRAQPGNSAAPRPQEATDTNYQAALMAEVHKLRMELLEFRFETQAAKIPALEHGLSQIEAQRARLAEEERAAPQQIANLEARFQGQTLLPEQRAEIESAKAAFAAQQAERSSTERSALQSRETELSAALSLEQQRLQALKSRLNELRATP